MTPPQIDSAIAISKEMLANGEDKDQTAGIAVGAGDELRKIPMRSGRRAPTRRPSQLVGTGVIANSRGRIRWPRVEGRGAGQFLMGVRGA